MQGAVRQATSHPHDRLQLTLRQDWVPLQSTLQAPVPQSTLRQLCWPLHMMVHDLAPAQLMPLLQALASEQAMVQLQPAGQVTCCLQPPLRAQSIVQVFAVMLHDVHPAGQPVASPGTLASTWDATQKPSMQVRPVLQSACFVQANSSLRWVTEQPPAVAAATANPMVSQSATSFTACLRS